jgi:large subunit ribosomal protein L10
VLKLEDKKSIVADLKQVVEQAQSLVVVDYRGLTVAEMDELRAMAREKQVRMQVVRNTLARLAVQDTEFACLEPSLIGPTLLAMAFEEPGAAAKVLVKFAKGNEKLEVRALSLGGQLLDGSHLKTIAKLPSREEALSMLMSVMNGPVRQLAVGLQDSYARLARITQAVADQKQAAA